MPKKFQIVYIFETQQVEESIFIFFFLFFVISWVSGQWSEIEYNTEFARDAPIQIACLFET